MSGKPHEVSRWGVPRGDGGKRGRLERFMSRQSISGINIDYAVKRDNSEISDIYVMVHVSSAPLLSSSSGPLTLQIIIC